MQSLTTGVEVDTVVVLMAALLLRSPGLSVVGIVVSRTALSTAGTTLGTGVRVVSFVLSARWCSGSEVQLPTTNSSRHRG